MIQYNYNKERGVVHMLPKCVTVGRYVFTQIRVDEYGVQYYSVQEGTDICIDYDHPFSSIDEMYSWVADHS